MKQIEITRTEFSEKWGIVPPGDAVSCMLLNTPWGDITYQFVGKDQQDIAELERLFQTQRYRDVKYKP